MKTTKFEYSPIALPDHCNGLTLQELQITEEDELTAQKKSSMP